MDIINLKTMGRLKLQMQVSLDGYVSTGPNDEQHWVTWAWDEIKGEVLELIDSTDTIIIGRKLAVDYIPHWQSVGQEDPMYSLAQKINKAKKIIFTQTLEKSEWENTTLTKGNLVEEINRLKTQSEKDIIVYGGHSFVSALASDRLIDEYHLFVNPVVLGGGESIFKSIAEQQNLSLKKSIAYNSGIVLLSYECRE